MSLQIDEKARVLLFQLPHPATRERNIPLAAAYLKTAVMVSRLRDRVEIEIYDALRQNLGADEWLVSDVVRRRPLVVGFTAFLWNVERILHISRRLKEELSELRVVLGGPEVVESSPYLEKNPHVDFWVFGEGEEPIVEILGHLLDGAPSCEEINGLAWRRGGDLVVQKGRNIYKGFHSLPSPYLEGHLREEDYLQNIILTMRGCRHGCRYCAWTSRGNLRTANLDTLRRELEIFHRGGTRILQIFDSSFNESPIFFEVCDLIAEINHDRKFLTTCFISAGSLTEEQVTALERCNVELVEVGLQALDEEVCRTICRFEKQEDFLRGISLLEKHGIPFIVDYILGLPIETYESFRRTVEFLRERKWYAECFNLSVSWGCDLRREAEKFGMEIQQRPPYYVLSTSTFTREELARAYLETSIVNSDTTLSPFWFPHPGFSASAAERRELKIGIDEEAGELPYSHFTLDLSRGVFFRERFMEIGRFVAGRAGFNTTVHFILSEGDIPVQDLSEFLRVLIAANRFINVSVILEFLDKITGAGVAILRDGESLSLLDAVGSLLASHRHFLDDRNVFCSLTSSNHYVRSSRLYRLLPQGFVPMEPLPRIHDVEMRPLCRLILPPAGVTALPDDYFKPWLDLFITFSADPPPQVLAGAMEELFRKKHPYQEICFARLDHQVEWERRFLRLIIERLGHRQAFFSSSKNYRCAV